MQVIDMKGTEKSYQIDFGTNAMCRIEEAFDGKSCGLVIDDLLRANVSVTDVRKFVRGLIINPPNPTLEETGTIIDDIGGIFIFLVALRQSRDLQALPRVDETPTDSHGTVAAEVH